METQVLAVNNLKPAWQITPKKFRSVHGGLMKISLSEWAEKGIKPTLSQYLSKYLSGLPDNLPPEVILDITKWAISAYEAWFVEKPEPELA